MITAPEFYLVAVPAVILTGLAKGGFLSTVGGFAVPLMALSISPVEAAGIMLPILIIMDLIGVGAYRRDFDLVNLRILLPPAIAGVALGWATAALVSEAHVRLLVGVIGLVFAARFWWPQAGGPPAPTGHNAWTGGFWGLVSGFTSFVSHTGGPPLQVYLLPQRLPNAVYAGTAVAFFTIVNWAKVVPYGMLGQLNVTNLSTTAVLMPLAPIAMLAGIWLTRRVGQEPFYRIAYAGLLLISIKLVADAVAMLI